MSALTLPDIKGLLRECSPVSEAKAGPLACGPLHGVVVALGDEWDRRVRVAWQVGPERCKPAAVWSKNLTLRLDPTGLDHAVKWLVERAGLRDVQAIAEYGGSAVWVLHIRYNGRNDRGWVRGDLKWDLDSKPATLAHAVRDVCLREAA